MLNVETKTLKVLVPYGSILLVFLGILKMTIYYHAFNIQINHFLDFSETITSFLGDLLSISCFFIAISFANFLLTSNSEIQRTSQFHDLYLSEKSLKKRIRYVAMNFGPLILVDIISIVLYLIVLWTRSKNTYYLTSALILINLQIFLSFLLLEYKRKYYELFEKPLNSSLYNLMLYFLIICGLLINRTYDEIHDVKVNKRLIHTSFTTNQGIVKSDSLHYYIGQTKNYLFFYNQDKNVTTAYPISEIKEITFGK